MILQGDVLAQLKTLPKPYFQRDGFEIYLGDALDVLRQLPDQSVNCCVTSPPYWGLRNYSVDGQLGLEPSPKEYVAKLVAVFAEVRRVLRDDGTLWLNLGDSYSGSGKGGNPEAGKQATNAGSQSIGTLYGKVGESAREAAVTNVSRRLCAEQGMASKQLIGIPWRVAFALQDDGWYLRSDIIWAKPNPMPESMTDRPTKSHEYIFLLAKSATYHYDHEAIKEPAIYFDDDRKGRASDNHKSAPTGERNGIRADKQRGHSRRHAGFNDRWDAMSKEEQCGAMRNKRDVWTVSPAQFSGAHFATFPPELIKPCILAGCPKGGTVLDPFSGSGTALQVARDNGCAGIGIELNPAYIDLAARRLEQGVLDFSQ